MVATTNEDGHALLTCPACGKRATFTLELRTVVSYPFVRVNHLDLFGDERSPTFDFEAEFEGAYCDACYATVDEEVLRRLYEDAFIEIGGRVEV